MKRERTVLKRFRVVKRVNKKQKNNTKQRDSIGLSDLKNLLTDKKRGLTQVQIFASLNLTLPKDQRKVARSLKGLVKSQEISLSADGRFVLRRESKLEQAIVTRSKPGLMVAGFPIESPPRTLRDGDEIRFRHHEGVAEFIDVVAYSEEPLVGELDIKPRYAVVEILGSKFRGRVSVSGVAQKQRSGDIVSVRIDGEDRHGLTGYVVDTVATAKTTDRASQTLLASLQIPTEWPEEVIAEAEKVPKAVRNIGKRQDLTQTPFVTIDGEDARDFDDAVFCEAIKNGWRLMVAIADVGNYVKAGTALDQEAYKRSTSVYLPDRVIPMLPESLSNEICSLKPGVKRNVLVCDMSIARSGSVREFDFFEAVISSHARLTYDQVADFIVRADGKKMPPLAATLKAENVSLKKAKLELVSDGVKSSVLTLKKLLTAFQKARVKRGGLEFNTSEAGLKLKNGKVVALVPIVRNDAHRMIEEAMIAANVCAAKFIEQKDSQALFRCHVPPSVEKLKFLEQAFSFAGTRFKSGDLTPRKLCAAVDQVNLGDKHWLFEMLVLRSMMQANYQPENAGHFGLGLTHYMHFTSPIRRYPDLIVHRVIKNLLNHKKNQNPSEDWLFAAGEHTSMAERRAEDAERGVKNWLKCEFVEPKVGETMNGVVVAVTEFGLFVELEGYFVQGLLHISNLGRDYFVYHAPSMSLVGEKSGQKFALGDGVQVILEEVQCETGKIDLLLTGQLPTRRSRRSRK